MPLDVGSTPLTTHSLGKLAEDYSVENDARLDQQHDGQGAHTDVTLDSIGSNDYDPATAGGRVGLYAGVHILAGPWDFGLTDSEPGVAVIRPTSLTADVDDYHPEGLETACIVELESTAERTITGLYQEPRFGDAVRRRRLLWLVNRGNYTIVLASASASSQSAYRLYFGGGNYPLLSGSTVYLLYDPGSGGWRGPAMTGFRSVQRGTISITGANTNNTATLATTLTDLNKSVLSYLGSGTVVVSGADAAVPGWLSDLTTTSLKGNRASTAGGDMTLAYQVVEYY